MSTGKLGTYLREGREAAGLTTETIAQETRIPRASLEALEEERFDDLPALVFVKGFVRSYCSVVAIDPRPALEQLSERPQPAESGPALLLADVRQPLFLTHVASTRPRSFRLSRVIIVLVAIAILVAAYVLAGDRSGGGARSTAATDGAPAATEQAPPAGGQRHTPVEGP